jgi:SNF2 family DNA or RNA helicase
VQIERAKGRYCYANVTLTSDSTQHLRNLPGFSKWVGRKMMFAPTGANIKHIQKHWPEAVWDDESKNILNDYIMSLRAAEDRERFSVPENDDYMFETKPFDHQRRAFYMSRDKENFALLMEQGTGKTKIIIDTAAYLYANNKITALVIIAPNGVHRNWLRNEIPFHLPEWCPRRAIYYSAAMKKKEKDDWDDLVRSSDSLKIFSFNVEGFVSKNAQALITSILRYENALLVVDESSRIKRPGAKRTQFVTKIGKLAKYRRILTGTPVTKGPEDVFSQFRFLDPYILGYESFYSFKARYCIMGGYENRQIVAYENVDELTKNIEGHSYRVLKKDCLDLPDKIYQRAYVDLSEAQRRLYNAMKDEWVASHQEKTIEAPEAITRLLRLQQITCGWFPSDEPVPIDEESPRLGLLKEILSDIEGKVIIWARFRADLRAIEDALGELAVAYHGGVSNDARANAVDAFQNDPKIRYFIGQPQSGGIGLTLTAANYAIYYSNSFDLEVRLQSEDRCHRIGTTNNVTYIDIEANKTIDKKIIKALRDKKNLADMITRDPISIFMEEENEI